MLRMCVLDFGGDWERYLPFIEFGNSNSYHSTIAIAPYEALHGRKCKSPVCWMEIRDKHVEGLDLILETSEKIPLIQNRLKTAFSR